MGSGAGRRARAALWLVTLAVVLGAAARLEAAEQKIAVVDMQRALNECDAGNAYSADQGFTLDETRFSAGAGVRWLSPIGPLRIELGKPFNTKPHDQKSLVLFSFGAPFQY